MIFRSLLMLVLGMILCSKLSYAQTQIGTDLDAEATNDRSGYSVSMSDNKTIAIGAIQNDGSASNAGHVRVYRWSGSAWIQKGADINGEAAHDNSGYSVCLPDSNTVAIGAYRNDGNGGSSGHVRVYSWDGSSWNQKGADIDGEMIGDESGSSIAMANANNIVIGAPKNDGNGTDAGHVRVYNWNGAAWVQVGSDIDGVAGDYSFGWSVSMPDSSVIAVSAKGDIFESGEVRIYKWNGVSWTQKGSVIQGEAAFDLSGISIDMPDTNTVAIGAANNDGNGNQSGHVRIFRWNGSDWGQKGSDIDGEAAEDLSGSAVSMGDSNTVAIGANWNDGNGNQSGHVRIFEWNGVVWQQSGSDIDGEAADDQSGFSVSMPSTEVVGIGAYFNGGTGFGAGHTRVYSLCEDNTIDVITTCGSFTWIDGNTYTSSNNSATHTLTNVAGCDSVVTLNLTINNANTGTDTQVACGSFTWVDGNTYTSSNNTATHTLTNVAGCDSVVTLNLTINNANTGTDTQVACGSFTWVDGNTYTSSNNTATHTLTNVAGCDSVVTLNLTINNANTGVDTQVACGSFTWIDGNTYTSSNNTATHTLTNVAGCDSVVTLNLTINNANTGVDTQVACESFTWIDGNTYTSSNNTATHTLTNVAGCDSVVTLNLTINNANTGTDTQVACGSFTWIDGNTYTSSNNTATHTLTNVAGCDSVVTLNLTINNANTGTDTQVACGSFIWIDGNTYTSSNNTATHTLTNVAGCDSVVTLNLTINNANTGTDTQVACASFTWIDGNTYTLSNNTATHTLTNVAGCDSVVTLNLTINNANTGVDTQVACGSFTWIDGNTYTSSNNTATHTLTNVAGCDSVVTLNLTINSITDLTTTANDPTIIANNSQASYVWLDCDNGYDVIIGETDQVFTATENGNYAVEITEFGCVDTSECVSITSIGITENQVANIPVVYPNPAKEIFNIEFDKDYDEISLTLLELNGRFIREISTDGGRIISVHLTEPTGVYWVEAIVDGQKSMLKLIKL